MIPRLLAALALVAVTAAPALGAERVRLPTEADAVAVALGAESIFFGPRGVETLLPGPVHDRERVLVGLGPEGEVRRIEVVQQLLVTGLGDFQFKVPGPARDVEALPASEVAPGLRRGSVLWQGFSDGEKLLAARMPLFPEQEVERLPVTFDVRVRVDGRPVPSDGSVEGELLLELTVRNTSAIPIGVQRGDADPRRLAPVLEALRAALEDRRRPAPGRGGVPEAVSVRGEAETVVEEIEAPFRIEGAVRFPDGGVRGLRAEGGDVHGSTITFEALLGGGRPLAHTLVVRGEALGAAPPQVAVTGEPAPPDPALAAPPGGGSWSEVSDGRAMLDATMDVLWRVARLRQFDAYLGNPDPDGPASTTYRFELDPSAMDGRAAARPTTPTSAPPPAWAIAITWALLLLAVLLGVVAWAHA